MSKYMWLVVSVGIVAIIGLYFFWSSTHITFNPETIAFTSILITKERIEIIGTSASSAIGYTKADATYENGALYFTVQGSMHDTFFSRIRPFVISMSNTYGVVREIYIRGAGADILVWKDGSVVK